MSSLVLSLILISFLSPPSCLHSSVSWSSPAPHPTCMLPNYLHSFISISFLCFEPTFFSSQHPVSSCPALLQGGSHHLDWTTPYRILYCQLVPVALQWKVQSVQFEPWRRKKTVNDPGRSRKVLALGYPKPAFCPWLWSGLHGHSSSQAGVLHSLHLLCHTWWCCQSLAQDPFVFCRQLSQAPVRNLGLHLPWTRRRLRSPLWHFTGATQVPPFLLFGVNGGNPGLMKTMWNEAVSAVTRGNSVWGFEVVNVGTTNRTRFVWN